MTSLGSLDQVGLEGFLFQDCLFQGWSRGIWTTTVFLWSTAPRASLESLDQVGLLVRSTFHRVGSITSKVLQISGKIFDDWRVLFVQWILKLNSISRFICELFTQLLKYSCLWWWKIWIWTLFGTIVNREFNEHEHIIKDSNQNDKSKKNYKLGIIQL